MIKTLFHRRLRYKKNGANIISKKGLNVNLLMKMF